MRFRRPPCVPHTRQACCRVARPGIEPGPTASEAVMRSSTLTSQVISTPTWNRTRTRTLGEFDAFRYTIGTKSRRLDLHQHYPVYKTGAFLSRATSATAGVQGVEPCSAVLEAACFPEAHSCNQGRSKGVEHLPPASQAGVPTAYTKLSGRRGNRSLSNPVTRATR